MIRYTKEFERYWGHADKSAFGYVLFSAQETIKQTAYKAWMAARRPRVPVRKRSGF